jgi:hypothetical protein
MAPVLRGILPKQTAYDGPSWKGLAAPWPLTGVLVLGRGWDRELDFSYSYPWKLARYRTVMELRFEAGRLTAAIDRSAAVDTLRRAGRPFSRQISLLEDQQAIAAWEELLAQLDAEVRAFARQIAALEKSDYVW